MEKPVFQKFSVCDFDMIALLGEGSYGTVMLGERESKKYAIKRLAPFTNSSSVIYMRRTYRELKILNYLAQNQHHNIVSLLETFSCPNGSPYIYLVFEKMDADLHRVIRIQKLSNEHVKYFLFQILSACHFLHLHNILHRDLKPSNILINSNCMLKLADFGLSRVVDTTKGSLELSPVFSESSVASFTEYVQTRWYRAPETILRPVYSTPVDMWSVGCIFAEMMCRRALLPGSSTYNQLIITIDITSPNIQPGDLRLVPNEKIRNALKDYLVVSAGRRKISLRRHIWAKYPFIELEYESAAWSLLEKLLTFDPNTRITAAEALKHPYLATYHQEESEQKTETGAPFSLTSAGEINDKAQLKEVILAETNKKS